MVKIVGDTTSTLPLEVVERYGIPIVPQVINFGAESYLEGAEIDNATFMEKLADAQELPKTAAPPPDLFVELFRKLVPEDEPVICILPSAVVSGTVRSATLAAREFPDADIRVIDTRFVASPVGSMLVQAARWAAEGATADEIETRVYAMASHCHVYFVVDTLKYLALGGRIGGAAALLGSVLRVKPVLTMEKGRIEMLDKVRTQKRAVARLAQLVEKAYPRGDDGHLTVMHAAVPEQARAFADDLAERLGLDEIPLRDVPPAIVVHGGPGVLGVSFFANEERADEGA
jgi:DegV family protein with EDD domain